MEPQTTSAAASTLSSIGHSLASFGTSAKAFAVAHPIGTAFVAGAIVGVLAYTKLTKKNKAAAAAAA